MPKHIYRPVFIKGDKTVAKFLRKERYIIYTDDFVRQVKELFFIENKEYIDSNKEAICKSDAFKNFAKKEQKNYKYIYYPWNHNLVKCASENDFFKLRTNRNQDLITAREQIKLYNRKIAVFGLSVGSNIVYTLTQAGISKNIIIADFDELDTTNLNRIQAGVHQIGLNKTIVCARRIYEENPYAIVRLLQKGINPKILDKLLKARKIDCIVEEVDSLPIKISIRHLARKYKIPVVMVTDNGDGIVIHVERYDLGYKKIFEKKDAYWRRKIDGIHSRADIGNIIINDIVGGPKKVDPKMLASIPKVINRKLVSWPQLGSAAILGGVAVTIAIKNIFLGRKKKLFLREYIRLP